MNQLLILSYLVIIGLWGLSQYISVDYVVHLMVLVTAILIAACHESLALLHEPKLEEGEEKPERDVLRSEDAYQFPIVGSISLFSLYLAVKFLGKEYVNLLISGYFGMVGVVAVTATLSPLIGLIITSKKNWGWKWQLKHPLPEWIGGPSPWDLSASFVAADVVALMGGLATIALYLTQGKPWFLNNVLGICFCLQGISRFSLGTYKIGAILLVGLFFYDIFWVFGTEVMVTVAKNLDGPIKILFPKSLERNEDGKLDLSLLGLGDIVIPGFFIALLLRFDAHQAGLDFTQKCVHASFPKPYFWTCLIAYIMGLGTTLFVMMKFNAAQPALLYLVPACLGGSFLCAVVRGEVTELLAYSEEEEEGEEEGDVDTKKDK